ncbi:hypothetical protein [Actinomadura sp. 3N407]|uniref:hypothetical protein n=1 Tax=Actinomadura sp. 3N407 TaxID=3457423 RepID=UPI003FCD1BA7
MTSRRPDMPDPETIAELAAKVAQAPPTRVPMDAPAGDSALVEYLAALPEQKFQQEVQHYLWHPTDSFREALHDAALIGRLSITLDRLKHATAQKIETARSSKTRYRLAELLGLIQAEIRQIQQLTRRAEMLTGRRSDIYTALLVLAELEQPKFQAILAEVRRQRKKGRKAATNRGRQGPRR